MSRLKRLPDLKFYYFLSNTFYLINLIYKKESEIFKEVEKYEIRHRTLLLISLIERSVFLAFP